MENGTNIHFTIPSQEFSDDALIYVCMRTLMCVCVTFCFKDLKFFSVLKVIFIMDLTMNMNELEAMPKAGAFSSKKKTY